MALAKTVVPVSRKSGGVKFAEQAYRYLREADPQHFQPMNANFGLLDDLPQRIRDKKKKREMFAERALSDMREWIEAGDLLATGVGRR